MTTPTGTPARCKKCKKKRVFRAEDVFGSDYRKRPTIQPSRVHKDEIPFSRDKPWLRGAKI